MDVLVSEMTLEECPEHLRLGQLDLPSSSPSEHPQAWQWLQQLSHAPWSGTEARSDDTAAADVDVVLHVVLRFR